MNVLLRLCVVVGVGACCHFDLVRLFVAWIGTIAVVISFVKFS